MNRNRREFVTGLVATAGSAGVLASSGMPAVKRPARVETIQDVIDLIVSEILPEPLERTIDTVKTGDSSQPVTGVASTCMPTFDVLKRAHAIGANLVIPHEPTWYNHYDKVDHLQGDPVFEAKMRFLEDTGLVIWRFHDYSHRMKPDVIVRGVVKRLGYDDYQTDPDDDRLYDVPGISFEHLVQRCKSRLGISHLKVVGDPGTKCRRVAIFTGWGSSGILDDDQVLYLVKKKADVVICGESAELVTCEYVRDAVEAGIGKGLIILGHAASEEPGTADVVEWLQPLIPEVKVTFVPAGDPFRFL